MRIVLPGGSGQVGGILQRGLRAQGHEVQVIGRGASDPSLRWDGRTPGAWWEVIDGADAVIQLTGQSVNCRYTWPNLNAMMASRVDSALAVGHAIAGVRHPPPVWLQASTASIYTHSVDVVQDEDHGRTDPIDPHAPAYWAFSIHIARAWELALASVPTPATRKVAMRLGFTMSPDKGGIFDWLVWLVAHGLGGPFCGGRQYVSWIADVDLVRAVSCMLHDPGLVGPVNVTAPEPIPNAALMAQLRDALGVRFGLPITPWMAEVGAVFLKTDTELMQKSRRVVPRRLLDAGMTFALPRWEDAAVDLVRRTRGPAAPAITARPVPG
ncbi:MAG: DUF1731 domain-containing protein [Alphaproteobacteria bacterium]|nr:DUF1731 domain-containing protein [Alphaproteobacteria bacterium]